jgi:apolipoprotein N-acyltransferase
VSLSEQKSDFAFPAIGGLSKTMAGLKGWSRAAASFGLGAASMLGFAPFHFWPLLFVILPAFVWLLDGIAESEADRSRGGKPQWRQAMLAGWWFGFGFFVTGLYWTGFAFFVEADKYALLVPLAVAAFPAGLAIFFALASGAAIAFWRPGAGRIFVLAATFFIADWLRGHMLTGFPWNIWGYALAGNEAVAQSASLFGIYGLTLLSLVIFASPAALAGPSGQNGRGWLLPALCLAILASGWAWGTMRLASASNETVPDVRLRIVQANVPQAEKWKRENRQWIFKRYLDLSDRPGEEPTHVIWPETATPFIFMVNDRIFEPDAQTALSALTGNRKSLILGGERVDATPRADGTYRVNDVYNSLFVLGPDGTVKTLYDKVHLVPFGEYLPFQDVLGRLGIEQLTHGKVGFASGILRATMTAPGAPSFLPLICYEAIFPGLANEARPRPGWLLNLTNDGWFGTSSGPYQHLHQTRLRAIEQGLPLIRAANTGISAVVDAYGRIQASLPLNAMGVIDHALPVAIEPTLFTQWGENCLMLLAFLVFILYRIVMQVE